MLQAAEELKHRLESAVRDGIKAGCGQALLQEQLEGLMLRYSGQRGVASSTFHALGFKIIKRYFRVSAGGQARHAQDGTSALGGGSSAHAPFLCWPELCCCCAALPWCRVHTQACGFESMPILWDEKNARQAVRLAIRWVTRAACLLGRTSAGAACRRTSPAMW
jgi:superfamily I DNA/RNA helicase